MPVAACGDGEREPQVAGCGALEKEERVPSVLQCVPGGSAPDRVAFSARWVFLMPSASFSPSHNMKFVTGLLLSFLVPGCS